MLNKYAGQDRMNGNNSAPPPPPNVGSGPKSFFSLSHLAAASASPFLPPWPSNTSPNPLLFGSMVVPQSSLSLPEALQQVTQQFQQRVETPRSTGTIPTTPGAGSSSSSAAAAAAAAAIAAIGASLPASANHQPQTSPNHQLNTASVDSDDDDLSSDGAGPASTSRKRAKKGSVDESEGNSGGDEDKTKKRREQIAAASRASRARRKRELEDLRSETKQLKDEREKLIDTIQKMQRKVEDLQQRPIMLVENPAKASTSGGVTYPNVLCEIGARSPAVIALMTILRDRGCSRSDFVKHSERVCRLLVEEGLARCKLMSEVRVTTPTDAEYLGLSFPNFEKECCIVSIMRSGDIIGDAIRAIVPNMPVGKVLIQRQEDTAEKTAKFYWSKLPHDIATRYVFVCDPMLGTGGTIISCLKELVSKKVNPRNILFLNIVSCPEGLQRLHREFPEVMVVTCAIDSGLTSNCYITPGLGDYGDRFYHTTEH